MVPTYCHGTARYLNGNISLFFIYIFMKININIRIKRKIAEKTKGTITKKITNIAAANCPRAANIILNLSL